MIEFEEKKIKKLLKRSFTYTYSLTSNHDLAREISASAIYQYYLSKDSIKNPDAWIIKVSSNLFKKSYKKYLKEEEILEQKKLIIDFETEEPLRCFNQISTYLETDELEFLLKYFSNIERSELISEYGLSNDSIRKKVSILKKKINARINIDKGYKYGNDLILPEIDQKITFFLRSLKKALKNKNLAMMKNYLSLVNQDEIDMLKSISVIKKYLFQIVDNNLYSIVLVYQDDEENYLCLVIMFSIQNKHLRVLSIKDLYSKGIVIKEEKAVKKIKKIINNTPRTSDGRVNIELSEIKKIEREAKESK